MPQTNRHHRVLHCAGQDQMAKRDDPIGRRIEFIGEPKSQTDRHPHAHAIDQLVNVGIEETDGMTKQIQRVRQGFKGNGGLNCLIRKVGFQGMSSLRSFGRRICLNTVAGFPARNSLNRCAVKILRSEIIFSEAAI